MQRYEIKRGFYIREDWNLGEFAYFVQDSNYDQKTNIETSNVQGIYFEQSTELTIGKPTKGNYFRGMPVAIDGDFYNNDLNSYSSGLRVHPHSFAAIYLSTNQIGNKTVRMVYA